MINPVTSLPFNIAKKFREMAHYLLADLEDNKFHVVLTPAPNPKYQGHKIRQATAKNPEWYKEVFDYKSKRASRDTRDKHKGQGEIRKRVGSALLRIMRDADGHHVGNMYSYDRMLRELIKKMLCEGYETSLGQVPPNDEAVEYFTEK